ncbi:transposase family protein [Streptomyces sp. NPDC002088]|uniref:transposase family protein n=1 Tax=Streptomyces sp. NPDC002088 TaxID=3154665 RepID=UPI003333208A
MVGSVATSPVVDAREAPGRTVLTTRSSAEPEASRWSPMLPRSMSRVTSWCTSPGCSPRIAGASTRPVGRGSWAHSGRRSWCCAGSVTAAACTAWPGTPESRRPPATATCTRPSTSSPLKPPDLHEVLNRCREEGMSHVILDGMLIESDRLTGTRDNGNDLWFSQKHKSFGGNVQFLAAPDGTPLWVSDADPGSTPDITAARLHVPRWAAGRAAPVRVVVPKQPLRAARVALAAENAHPVPARSLSEVADPCKGKVYPLIQCSRRDRKPGSTPGPLRLCGSVGVVAALRLGKPVLPSRSCQR